ncbi:unnamed protein product [uncultured bacterium]|nr:unnamed protein product [uncultured bacterium]
MQLKVENLPKQTSRAHLSGFSVFIMLCAFDIESCYDGTMSEVTSSLTGMGADEIKEPLRRRMEQLAESNLYVGTSSWKYEGWLGQIYSRERYEYRGKIAKNRFEADCLREYAEVFKTVCVDAGYYRFPTTQSIEKLAGQVPEGFLLSFKVTDEITLKHFPQQARHGARAGLDNANFLNAELFADEFLGQLEPFRDKIGILMFEFTRFTKRDYEHGRDFVEALDAFLGKLPRGWQYGVEIRNQGFLQPKYFEALKNQGVTHVFNSWSAMPPVSEQMAMEGAFTADYFASRFLLKPGRTYEAAVKNFSPYREVKEAQESERAAIKALAARTGKKRSFIYVNNRLEGNALQTIAAALEILTAGGSGA